MTDTLKRIKRAIMNRITKCPSCGSVKIRQVRRKWSGEYQGQHYTVEKLDFYECADCKEHVYDPDAMRAIEANSPAFAKSVAT